MVSSDFFLAATNKALRIGVIILVSALILQFLKSFVRRLLANRPPTHAFYFDERRVRTLSILLHSIIRYGIYFVGILLILQEFNVNTTSIVAGAGFVGLAVGVGAQSLIKDLITGLFIILEDQYAVGDYISCSDMAGTVVEIGFRVTKLRDDNGVMHTIPHGLITKTTNFTRGHMAAVVMLPLPYQTDVSAILSLLEESCRGFAAAYPEVVEGPRVVGIVEFRSSDFVVKIAAKTTPLKQGRVEAALRHKIKQLLEQRGIIMPPLTAKGI